MATVNYYDDNRDPELQGAAPTSGFTDNRPVSNDPLPDGWSVTGQNGKVPFAGGYGPNSPGTVPENPNGGSNESRYMPSNPGAPALGKPSLSENEIRDALSKAGIQATPDEMRGQLEAANKYGSAGILNNIAARTNNSPGSGQQGSATWADIQARPGAAGSQSVPTSNAPGGTAFNYGNGNVPAQFSDPITSYLERFAQNRAQQLESPAQGSGQNLLETALKAIAGQFQQGGYTPAEQEVLNTQGIEPIEQLRQARKQQVMQTLSARGIDPKSGVGIQMIADVDRQFDMLRTQTQRSIAGQSAQETQSRMLQAIQLLTGLAGTESQRQDQAFQYRSVPYNLGQQAFQNASSLYNTAGNPNQVINPLLQLQAQQQGQQNSVGETLGYLAYFLSQGSNAA